MVSISVSLYSPRSHTLCCFTLSPSRRSQHCTVCTINPRVDIYPLHSAFSLHYFSYEVIVKKLLLTCMENKSVMPVYGLYDYNKYI